MDEAAMEETSKWTYSVVRISASHSVSIYSWEIEHLEIHRDTHDPLSTPVFFPVHKLGPLRRFQKGNNESQRPRAICQEAKGVICLMSIFISYLHPQLVRGGFKAAWFMLRKAMLIKTSRLCTWDNVCKTPRSTLEAPPLHKPQRSLALGPVLLLWKKRKLIIISQLKQFLSRQKSFSALSLLRKWNQRRCGIPQYLKFIVKTI